jgi:hypothetical protein
MAEIEAMLADEMDVSASVQLERLEELERALTALDPDQFVRKNETGATPAPRHTAPPAPIASTLNLTPVAGLPSTSLQGAPTLPTSSPTSSTEPSLSSF